MKQAWEVEVAQHLTPAKRASPSPFQDTAIHAFIDGFSLTVMNGHSKPSAKSTSTKSKGEHSFGIFPQIYDVSTISCGEASRVTIFFAESFHELLSSLVG